MFFTVWGRQPHAQPPTWRTRSLIYNPRDWVAQLYPQALGSHLVAFYNMQGIQWDNSLIPVTTREVSTLTFNYYYRRTLASKLSSCHLVMSRKTWTHQRIALCSTPSLSILRVYGQTEDWLLDGLGSMLTCCRPAQLSATFSRRLQTVLTLMLTAITF